MSNSTAVLQVEGLCVEYARGAAVSRVVDAVSFRLSEGEIVGLVGESGCGKSTLGSALLRLVSAPGRIASGHIWFEGRDLLGLPEGDLRQLRGQKISMIAQDALAVLNPVVRVGRQVAEVVRDHIDVGAAETRQLVLDALRRVRLSRPALTSRNYPHELSGGMQQRIVIAEGVILNPCVLVADEPTTALDVTVQSQILDLLVHIRDESGTAILLITHDLAMVADVCDRVMVMYGGRIVETGLVEEIFYHAEHPYTRALLAGLLPLRGDPPEQLSALTGQPPHPDELPSGCRFHPRCPLWYQLERPDVCVANDPIIAAQDDRHRAACHFAHLGAPFGANTVEAAIKAENGG
jgi:oligopeptide/dipeptide ABC transporter ATP-binding protein